MTRSDLGLVEAMARALAAEFGDRAIEVALLQMEMAHDQEAATRWRQILDLLRDPLPPH